MNSLALFTNNIAIVLVVILLLVVILSWNRIRHLEAVIDMGEQSRKVLSESLCEFFEGYARQLIVGRANGTPHPLRFIMDGTEVRAAMPYSKTAMTAPLEQLKRLKYGGVGKREARLIAARLACWYVAQYGLLETHATLLVCVPSSVASIKARGFNQAALIASELASLLAIPFDGDVLTRQAETTGRQAKTKNRNERLDNVTALYSASSSVTGHVIVLIDDVTTTGATITGCASALRAAGAIKVYGLTLAAGTGAKGKLN